MDDTCTPLGHHPNLARLTIPSSLHSGTSHAVDLAAATSSRTPSTPTPSTFSRLHHLSLHTADSPDSPVSPSFSYGHSGGSFGQELPRLPQTSLYPDASAPHVRKYAIALCYILIIATVLKIICVAQASEELLSRSQNVPYAILKLAVDRLTRENEALRAENTTYQCVYMQHTLVHPLI